MPALQFGLDRLLTDPALRRPLRGRRLALLAHPASVSADLRHALDALAALPDLPQDLVGPELQARRTFAGTPSSIRRASSARGSLSA